MPWGTSVKADAQRWEGLRFQLAATMACLYRLLDVCCEGFVFPKTIHQNQENVRHVCFTQKNFAIQMLQSMVFCFESFEFMFCNVLHQFQTQPTCWVCLAFTMCRSYLFLRAAVFRWAPVVQWASQGNGAHQNSWGSLIPPTGWPWRFVFPVKRRIHEARGRLDQSGICPVLGAWWTPFWNILDALLAKHGLRFPLIMASLCLYRLQKSSDETWPLPCVLPVDAKPAAVGRQLRLSFVMSLAAASSRFQDVQKYSSEQIFTILSSLVKTCWAEKPEGVEDWSEDRRDQSRVYKLCLILFDYSLYTLH